MEENWIYAAFPVLGKVVITVILIFSTIIFFTRISGLCTFAKMSSFDFASTIAIGSILASVIMNTNQSLLKGAVALGSIITFQSIFTFLARKSKPARKFMTNDPMMLMYQGEILWDNLDKTNVGKMTLWRRSGKPMSSIWIKCLRLFWNPRGICRCCTRQSIVSWIETYLKA